MLTKAFGIALSMSPLAALFFILATASTVVPVLAQPNDTVTVDVSILSFSEITVLPSALNFTVNPGRSATDELVDIRNTGSLNVSLINAYVDTLTTENVRPYGSASSLSYAAGGVLIVKNNSNPRPFFAGRIEWNESSEPSNMITNNLNSPVSWGFFRNTSNEYAWSVGNGTPSSGSLVQCNGTGSQFAINDIPDNGTAATRTPTTTGINMDGGDANYGYFSVTPARYPLNGSCVAVTTDCSKIYIYKYDKRSGFGTCSNSAYIQSFNMIPGDHHSLNMTVFAPFGVPAVPGNLNTSTFTVVAT